MTKAPPKFCNPWGATSVCEQVYRREKKCNMTCYFTQQVKENMMAKILKKEFEATHGHPKCIHHHK